MVVAVVDMLKILLLQERECYLNEVDRNNAPAYYGIKASNGVR